MWTYIFLERDRFTNYDYLNPCSTFNEKAVKILKEIPKTSPFGLQEWRKFFYKWCEFGHQVYQKKKIVKPELSINNDNDSDSVGQIG